MATAWKIAGPCDIWVDVTIANSGTPGTLVLLGRTTNDEAARIAITHNEAEKNTTASGAVEEQAVSQNASATVSFVLATWDDAVLESMRSRQAGGNAAIPVVGLPLIDSTAPRFFAVKIVPRIAGRQQWYFECCYMKGDSETIGPFTNEVMLTGLTVRAIPLPATNRLYTKSDVS